MIFISMMTQKSTPPYQYSTSKLFKQGNSNTHLLFQLTCTQTEILSILVKMLSNAVMVSSLKGPVLVPSSFLNLFCTVNHCQFLETFSSLVSLTLCLIFLPLSALLTTTFLLLAVHYFLHLLLNTAISQGLLAKLFYFFKRELPWLVWGLEVIQIKHQPIL